MHLDHTATQILQCYNNRRLFSTETILLSQIYIEGRSMFQVEHNYKTLFNDFGRLFQFSTRKEALDYIKENMINDVDFKNYFC